MYVDATAKARLAKLEEENRQLRDRLSAASEALLASSADGGGGGGGGVRAAGAAGTSGDDGGSVRGIIHPYFDPEDSCASETPALRCPPLVVPR